MEEIIALAIGLIAGVISGIVPGIHSNTVAQFFDSVFKDPILLGIAIIAATSVQTVLSFLPSIFLCIPESSTLLSVLPGQRMLKEGKGLLAIQISSFSALIALLASIVLIPLFFILIPNLYSIIRPVMAPVLTLICIALILQEKEISKIWKALFVFSLAGIFGFILLSGPILNEPLFTTFVGLFALSNLITTAKNVEIPTQHQPRKIDIKDFLPIILVGVLLGSVADIFPVLNSSAQMATFGSILTGADPGKFLSLTMSISVSHSFSSLAALYTINKARTGSVALIQENQPGIELNIILMYMIVAVIGVAVASVLLIFLSKYFVKLINSVNLPVLNLIILLYLAAAVLLVDGIPGILVCIVATSIGILPILWGIRRTHTMGFLLIPALIYLW